MTGETPEVRFDKRKKREEREKREKREKRDRKEREKREKRKKTRIGEKKGEKEIIRKCKSSQTLYEEFKWRKIPQIITLREPPPLQGKTPK